MHLFLRWNAAHSCVDANVQSVFCVQCPAAYQTLNGFEYIIFILLHCYTEGFLCFFFSLSLMTFGIKKDITQIQLTDNVAYIFTSQNL